MAHSKRLCGVCGCNADSRGRMSGMLHNRTVVLRRETGGIGYQTLIILLIFTILVLFFFRTPSPCKEPLTYRIGTVDERFGISRQEFTSLVRKAAAVWGRPLSHDLFREEPNGKIIVNLIYDYRQEASSRLKKLNYAIRYNKDSYEELKTRHEDLKREYEQGKSDLERDLAAYNSRVDAFNSENDTARRWGRVSEEVYNRLIREKEELAVQSAELHLRQDGLNRLVETMNSLVVVINEIAAVHNLDMLQYRDEGDKLGREFSKGNYTRKGLKEDITIYQFDSENSLVRVLVHEFGHALGIEHIDDPLAVMNRLVQNDESFILTEADIAALKQRCGNN